MTQFKLQFSGEIKKSREFNMGTKHAFELQLMKKNYAPQGAEPSWTWIKVMVVDPKDFQKDWFTEGKFIAGSGELSLKSYINKDVVKQQSIEIRCSSYDIDAPYSGVDFKAKSEPKSHASYESYVKLPDDEYSRPAPKRHVPVVVNDDDSSPPF